MYMDTADRMYQRIFSHARNSEPELYLAVSAEWHEAAAKGVLETLLRWYVAFCMQNDGKAPLLGLVLFE